MAEGVNLSKYEFLSAAAGLKPSFVEFSHPLDQSNQVRCHRRLTPFVFDEGGGGQKFVHPLQLNMHIHQKPLLLRVLPGALEGGIDILLTAATTSDNSIPK
jgi:hypothetical protein